MSCGVGCRHSSDLVLLWLWCRTAAAAPTGPLAWELPYATGAALKRQKEKRKNKQKTTINYASEEIKFHVLYTIHDQKLRILLNDSSIIAIFSFI